MTEIKGDLISRSDLKKSIEKYRPKSAVASLFIDGEHCMFMNCITEIDNAPTVEITKPQSYCMGFADGLAAQNYEKPPMFERQLGEWIPVSERLPEEHLCDDGYIEPSDYVLVWGDHGNYGVSRYWGNRRSKSESPNTHKDWVDLDWVVQKPIAWIPLPEPYKEGGKLV